MLQFQVGLILGESDANQVEKKFSEIYHHLPSVNGP